MRKRQQSSRGDGTLVIIGGHEDHDHDRVILKEVARLVPDGRLVIATIASDDPQGYIEKYRKSFGGVGITDVSELYVKDRNDAANEDHLKLLDNAPAVFFSGGDQLRITSQIGGTALAERIADIYRNGGLIAGTSAGASMMSETMLVKGPNAASFRIGDVNMAPGLGLLPDVIIDQHFAERGRIGRLIGAVSLNPRELGLGIDENTAIVVQHEEFRVIGSGGIYLVDASSVTHSDLGDTETGLTASVYDLKLHVLSSGDRFNLRTRRPVHEEARR